jgi:NAD(P)-dependent dehydrogenase (short-subunit alcohol dehydrogenase family)
MNGSGLEGKVALVTGGAGAIGAATCKRLAASGVRVAVIDIRGEAADKVAADILADGGEAASFVADLNSEDAIVALVEAVLARFGRIDILHNNAAAIDAFEKDGTLLGLTSDVWDKTFSVNVRAPMLLCREVVPQMIENGGGVIINTSSGASELPSIEARTAYGPSKAALETLTRYIAMQYGQQGIRANAILPGAVLTPGMKEMYTPDQLDAIISRTMLRRFNMPEDIAAMVHFLVSDDARQVTGELIRVDGGRP